VAETPESAKTGLVEADPGDAATFAVAFAQVMEPFAREQRIAEVEKARIEADAHKATVEAQERWLTRVVDNSLTRFKWIATIGTIFGLVVAGFAGGLLFTGHTTAGLMVMSHAVTLVVGLVGGRGLTNRSQRPQQPEQDS
jgi:hypothetical protein